MQCLHQMHRDIIFDYPPQVEQLGHTPRTQVPALYLPDKMISVQGHPEFNGDIVADIAKSRFDMGVFDLALYEDSMSRVRYPVSSCRIEETAMSHHDHGRGLIYGLAIY